MKAAADASGPATGRVLLLETDGRIAALLQAAGVALRRVSGLDGLRQALAAGADLAILAEAAVADGDLDGLAGWVAAQPTWSDFPFLVLARGPGGVPEAQAAALAATLGNVLFVEHAPVPAALARMVGTALRSRLRQAQSRRRIAETGEREQQLRIAQQAGGVGTFELFPRSGRLTLSAQFRQIYGMADKDRYDVGDVRPLIHPDDLPRVRTDDDFLPGQALDYLEYRILRADTGEVRWIARRGEAITDAATGIDRYVGVVYDITARRRTEERLEVSEGSLRLATDAAEIGTWDLDLTTDTLTWSDRTSAMFGVSPGKVSTIEDFYAGLHPEDLAATSEAFLAALDPARRTSYDVEYRTIGKEDGIVRWVAAKGRGPVRRATAAACVPSGRRSTSPRARPRKAGTCCC